MSPEFRFRPLIIVPTATNVLTWVAAFFLLSSPFADCSAKLGIYDDGKPELNQPYNLTCKLESELLEPSLWWAKNNVNLTEKAAKDEGLVLYKWQKDKAQFLTLEFTNLQLSHFNQYFCHSNEENGISRSKFVSVDFAPVIDMTVTENTLLGAQVNVTCKVTGYPLHGVLSWRFKDQELQNSSFLAITHGISNITQRESIITIHNVSDAHNGTYMCQFDGVEPQEIFVHVNGPPVITFDVIKPVGKDQIFLNWTLNDRNSRLEDLTLVFKNGNGDESKVTGIQRTRYVLKDLQPKTLYKGFTIFGKNQYGNASSTRDDNIWTRSEDPKFVPTIQVKGTSPTSVSLGWNTPVTTEDFQFYKVLVRDMDNPNAEGSTRIERAYGNDYIAARLESRTLYGFQVQACSEYTENCGELSNQLNITTMDGTSSEPTNVTCRVEDSSTISLTWDKPVKPRGQITAYEVTLKGSAEYMNHEGNVITEELQPIRKSVLVNKPTKIEFTNQPPNTNFSLSVCAVTNSKQCGENGFAVCSTPVTPPSPEELSKKVTWSTFKDSQGRILFRMNLSPISQRNGSICCLRVIVVRIPKDKKVDKLLPPLLMFDKITSYEQVHNSSETEGAYVAEIFDANRLTGWRSRQSIRVNIGDEEPTSDPYTVTQSSCHVCAGDRQGIAGSFRGKSHYPGSLEAIKQHRKRHAANTLTLPPHLNARDGPLDSGSQYTAYVVAHTIVKRDSYNTEVLKSSSKYLQPLNPREEYVMTSTDAENIGVMVIGVLIVMLLAVFVTLMCVMRWRRKEPADQEYGISGWAQQCWRRLGGQRLLPSIMQPDRPPIPKDQLVAAYTERHENADAGFQREFDDLPDHFHDRTSEASQKNIAKNRYPDIRAYDQTRVKLSTADGASDYINANIVVGYKERKKFICAQGPMETTIADWWRMVWEQRVHMIIMLTNIEEYNKQKCAKYWPSEEAQEYGNVSVTNASEKKYSDYLLRTLKLKLVGTEGEVSKDEREVEQYHYLVWKDYSAPEYPIGIIRFVKRFNEAYSMEKGPILVHCSAGVGRTGTLVALDSLLQQLTEEGQISVYNTIWDLRRQRNFLVQSLKQYIFIYRALMEFALFGDTEVAVKEIKPTLEKLKAIPDGKTVSRIEEEFERLTQVVEDRKPFTVGASEENKHRNRYENVIPYDGNRVILSPTPGPNKEVCMYINASFIEGYDSTDRYIIAQDPLDVTVGDFWRMIMEHNIRSIVMMSEQSEGKCPRYWPEKDQETNHGYIRVKYMQSQTCPFSYKREFNITNTKGDESCLVTQFQYNGWPGGESEVPESTRGIVELVDMVFKHKESLDKSYGATLVHCSAGTDRSCIFVALAILIQQMTTENRIDVFSTVRKLRSQRQGLFQNLPQYEFLYRSLDTYADLHVSNGNAPHGL